MSGGSGEMPRALPERSKLASMVVKTTGGEGSWVVKSTMHSYERLSLMQIVLRKAYPKSQFQTGPERGR